MAKATCDMAETNRTNIGEESYRALLTKVTRASLRLDSRPFEAIRIHDAHKLLGLARESLWFANPIGKAYILQAVAILDS